MSQTGMMAGNQVHGSSAVTTSDRMTWMLLAAVYAYVVVTPDPAV